MIHHVRPTTTEPTIRPKSMFQWSSHQIDVVNLWKFISHNERKKHWNIKRVNRLTTRLKWSRKIRSANDLSCFISGLLCQESTLNHIWCAISFTYTDTIMFGDASTSSTQGTKWKRFIKEYTHFILPLQFNLEHN